MKNNNPMKLSFNDSLLVYLFGTKDGEETMERLKAVCTALADEKFREAAFILKENIGKVSDYVWPELYRQTMWNMDLSIDVERYSWDAGDERDADEEDDAYGENE